MAPPGDLDALSPTELKARVLELLGKVAALEQTVAVQREEIARLKGLVWGHRCQGSSSAAAFLRFCWAGRRLRA